MTDFAAATRVAPIDDGRFAVDIPPGWEQGHAVYGGVGFGLLARALTTSEPTRALRSFTGELVAPVTAGPGEVTVERLRAGSRLTAIEARLLQDGRVCARATGLMGLPRASDAVLPALDPPSVPPRDELQPLFLEPPIGPAFGHHVTLWALPPAPFSGADQGVAGGWVDFRRFSGSEYRVEELIGLVDVYWPGVIAMQTTPRPAATVSFKAEPMVDSIPAGPLVYRARSLAGRDGYVVELRELWTADGRLVLHNQQCICLIH